VNGVGSAPVDMQKSTSVFSRPGPSSRVVQLRPQRSKPVSRPISMPVERLLNERNTRETEEREHLPAAIQETTEPDKPSTPRLTNYYRNPFIDTQTLRRTWDRQYRHYDVTPRTAMIVANLPSSDTPKPSEISVVPPSTTSRKDSTSQSGGTPISFRAPRTLKPPPGTFYRPPSVGQIKPFDLLAKTVSTATTTTTTGAIYTTAITIFTTAATSTVTTVSTAVTTPPTTPTSMTNTLTAKPTFTTVTSTVSGGAEEGLSENDSFSPVTLSPPQSPSSSAEELSPTDAKPLYQRRNRRMQELEHREAHFV
ncbi:hypothetical protein M9458_003612, partial [Cirrhinus mrigala]